MNTARNAGATSSGKANCTAQPMFHRVLRARPMIVRATLADIRRRFASEVDAESLGRLELVLAEVMNNVTEHGSGSPAPGAADMTDDQTADADTPLIHLCIVRHAGGLSCAVTDDGVSLPDGCLLPRSAPEAGTIDLPEGGFGWFLIQDLTQELCYYRERRRNFLAFRVPLAEETTKPES